MVVHGATVRRAVLASAVPAAVLFGYGLRGFAALGEVLAAWYVI